MLSHYSSDCFTTITFSIASALQCLNCKWKRKTFLSEAIRFIKFDFLARRGILVSFYDILELFEMGRSGASVQLVYCTFRHPKCSFLVLYETNAQQSWSSHKDFASPLFISRRFYCCGEGNNEAKFQPPIGMAREKHKKKQNWICSDEERGVGEGKLDGEKIFFTTIHHRAMIMIPHCCAVFYRSRRFYFAQESRRAAGFYRNPTREILSLFSFSFSCSLMWWMRSWLTLFVWRHLVFDLRSQIRRAGSKKTSLELPKKAFNLILVDQIDSMRAQIFDFRRTSRCPSTLKQ